MTREDPPESVRLAGGLLFGLILLAALAGLAPDVAADTEVRPYLGVRLGVQSFTDSGVVPDVRASSPLDAYGVALGVDLGRYLAVEIAADHFEPILRGPEGSLGELGILSLVPQVRLRYPLLDGRLVPYVVSGVGIGLSEFNDRKPKGFGRSIEARDTGVAWSIGAGVEYFVADNVAVGAEVRHLSLSGHAIELEGQRHTANLDSVLAMGALRAYLAGVRGAGSDAPTRQRWLPYLEFHGGGAHLVHELIARGLEARSDNASIASGVSQAYGFAVGIEVAPWAAVEVAGDGYEFNLAIPDHGTVAEYAFYAVLPQMRLSLPLLDGRLLPSVLAGAGVSYAEVNDRKPPGVGTEVNGEDYGFVGSVGVALEYRAVPNVGLAVGMRYLLARGHELRVGDRDARATLDAVVMTAGVRIRFR